MSGSFRSIVLPLLSALLWGLSFPVVVNSIELCGAGSVLTSIYGVAALVTLAFVAARHGIKSFLSISLSVEFFTRAILFLGQVVPLYVALELVDRAFLAGVFLCFFLWPVLALFYVKWFTKVKIARELTLFVGASFMVVALAQEFFEQGMMGLAMSKNGVAYSMALIAANSCALYAAVTRRFGYKGRGDVMTPMLCLGVALCGVALTIGNPDRQVLTPSWPLVLVGGVTGIAHILWDASVRRGNAFIASAIACFTPWIAIFSAGVLIGAGLVEHIEDCFLSLTLAMLTMGLVFVSPRPAGIEPPRSS